MSNKWTKSLVIKDINQYILSEKIGRIPYSLSKSCSRKGYRCQFVSDSKVNVRGQTSFASLLKHRRKLYNGQWADMLKKLFFECSFIHLMRSGNNFVTSLLILVGVYYYIIVTLILWLSVGFYVSALFITLLRLESFASDYDLSVNSMVFFVLRILIEVILVLTFIISISVNPGDVKKVWKIFAVLHTMFQLLVIMNMIIFTMFYEYENSIANAVLISVVIGIIFSVLFYGESYCKIILSFFAYIILLPTNINLCCLFAICRNEDYLWGQKDPDYRLVYPASFRVKRIFFIALYIILNSTVALFISNSYEQEHWNLIDLIYIPCLALFIFPFFGNLLFMLKQYCWRRKFTRADIEKYLHMMRLSN